MHLGFQGGMGLITSEDKQKIREATDLVALVGETVPLRQRGRDFWGCCPFHNEKSPSFHVIPDRGFWKCFSCGKGGDCFAYVMERDHLEFPEAVRVLAERAGIDLPDDASYERRAPGTAKKTRLYEAVAEAANFYHLQLMRVRSEGTDAARAYLGGRGFGSAVSDRWNLGYAPGNGALVRHLSARGFTMRELEEANLAVRRDNGSYQDRFFNRVMFPIKDDRGRYIGLGGRILPGAKNEKAKYLNTSETPIFHKGSNLFALDVAKSHITAQMEAVVMEGYTDVIASHEAGIQNAVAPLGTAFTPRHVKLLSRFLTAAGERLTRGRIVCLFDGDSAGIKAAEKALEFVSLTTAAFYCVVLPGGADPAEFLAAEGPDALRALIAQPQPLVKFVIDRHLDRFDVTTPEQRTLALADVVQAMAPIKGTPLADEYVEYVAGRLLADASTVRGALAAVRWTPPPVDDDEEDSDALITGVLPPDQASLPLASAAAPAVAGSFPGRPPALLPGDAQMVRIEREVLSTMAGAIDEARPMAERIAQVSWVDPNHEAIAWAILATPEGSSVQDVLTAAESVCPQAISIFADGTLSLEEGASTDRTLTILLDDLEMRGLRRRIEQGRARLRTADLSDGQDYDALFAELAALQQRLKELELTARSRT